MFSKKRQSRIWLILLIYKYVNTKSKLFTGKTHFTSISEIPEYIADDLIFAYEKGDIKYFETLYNKACDNAQKYINFLKSQRVISSYTMLAISVAFFIEMDLDIVNSDDLLKDYKKISVDYLEHDICEMMFILYNEIQTNVSN